MNEKYMFFPLHSVVSDYMICGYVIYYVVMSYGITLGVVWRYSVGYSWVMYRYMSENVVIYDCVA